MRRRRRGGAYGEEEAGEDAALSTAAKMQRARSGRPRGAASLAALVALVLAGCGEDRRPALDGGPVDAGLDAAPPDATPPDGGPRPDAGPPLCGAPLDVVFVIDTSTSMEAELLQVRTGIRRIWNAARALTLDTRFGLVVFVDDVVAVAGCTPFGSVEALEAELDRWWAFTSTNRQPNGGATSNTDCPENSLDALHAAATRCTWREGATRLIVHATDDTFAEPPALLSEAIPVQHGYAEVLEALTSRELRLGSFAAPGIGEFCGVAMTENVGVGWHEPYMGMPALPVATGGRAWNVRDVRDGELDMADAINELIADEYCTLY